jgi:hypothetical protein
MKNQESEKNKKSSLLNQLEPDDKRHIAYLLSLDSEYPSRVDDLSNLNY